MRVKTGVDGAKNSIIVYFLVHWF